MKHTEIRMNGDCKIYFLSVTPIGYIPLMRYIVPLFPRERSNIITTHINHSYTFNKYGTQKNIHVFPDINALNRHSKLIWFKKYFIILKHILLAVISTKKPVIYTVDVQVVAIAIRIKKMIGKKIKIIYHQFELLDRSATQGLNKKLQQYVLQNAKTIDLIIFPEITRSQYFHDSAEKARYESYLFPNTNRIERDSANESVSISGIPDDFLVIAHVGNIGPSSYVTNYVEVIKKFNQPKVAFLFIGNFPPQVLKLLQALSENDSRVKLIHEIQHRELLKLYHRIQVGIILYKGVDLNTEYCAPNKLYEYWSHGIPTLAHRLTGLQPVWRHEFQGKLVNFDDENEVIAGLDDLILNWKKYKGELKHYFDENLSIEHFLPEFKDRIESVIQECTGID